MATEKQADQRQLLQSADQNYSLDQVIEETYERIEAGTSKEMLDALIQAAVQNQPKVDRGARNAIVQMLAGIDQKISQQVSAVMHHEAFQKLEGSWRGLKYLCDNSITNDQLKIKVLNCSRSELVKDLRDNAYDQSSLWRAIYTKEYGTYGGEPFGVLVGDFEFGGDPEEINLLKGISGIAASALVPFVTAPAPGLFGMKDWSQLNDPRDLKTLFDHKTNKQYVAWQGFRESENSRYVAMVLPRTLARLPYGQNTHKVDEFDFEELPLTEKGEATYVPTASYCWMNSAYVYATQLGKAFTETGFCTRIRGVESGGKVENLPTYTLVTPSGDTDINCPTEVTIPYRREKELSDVGFISLVHEKNATNAVFFGGQTVQKPKKYDEVQATENAAITARLPYVFAASRIMHHLQYLANSKIGGFYDQESLQALLEKWLEQYILADSSSAEQKAMRPLREASVEVQEIPGSPGAFNVVALLRPWLGMEELNASVRIVTKVTQSR